MQDRLHGIRKSRKYRTTLKQRKSAAASSPSGQGSRRRFSLFRVYSSNSQCDRQRGIFALSKTFFRRNTDVFQGKMSQRSVKRPAVWVRWELEEYTLGSSD